MVVLVKTFAAGSRYIGLYRVRSGNQGDMLKWLIGSSSFMSSLLTKNGTNGCALYAAQKKEGPERKTTIDKSNVYPTSIYPTVPKTLCHL